MALGERQQNKFKDTSVFGSYPFTNSQGEIDKSAINTNSAKDNFINGIGKNGESLISLFEINSIIEEKESNS